MSKFVMRGYKGPIIHGAHSTKELEIRGSFHCQGPQPIDNDGGCPEWVWKLFEDFPGLEQIALNGESVGVVYTRIKEEKMSSSGPIGAKGVQGLSIGSKWNWRNQPERLEYMGTQYYPGDRRQWHQFALVGKPGVCWSEITDAELHLLEETK